MISELCYLTLEPNTNIETSTPESRTWQNILSTIASQDGYQSQYWGREFENPDIVVLVIDWDNYEKHEAFMKSAVYGSMTKSLTFALDVNFHHAYFTPHPPSLLKISPVTEFVTFYGAEDGLLENLATFKKALDEGKPTEYFGTVSGGVREELKREGKEDNGRAAVLCIGWESKDAHLRFRDTELFERNIWLLREKNQGVVMVHVAFKAYE